MSRVTAPAQLVQVEAFCNKWSLDLTVGCQHACVYCPFEKYQALTLRHAYPGQTLSRQLSVQQFLEQKEYPAEINLSGFTDPLAPAARDNLELVLHRVLPLGVQVGILTKGIVPRRIFRLLAANAEQVRLNVGITSLDDRRNAVVEPGCPPARARLANFRLAREYGLGQLIARVDPLLPGVDDAPEQLTELLDQIARNGAPAVTASYLFLTIWINRQRLRDVPYMGEAMRHCTEVCPVEGSMVYSVSLERKRQMYAWFHRECAARGLYFGTCGCRDLRLTADTFVTARNCFTHLDQSVCAAPALINRDR